MYITGIGNGKNIFYNIMRESYTDVELVPYNEFVNSKYPGIIFYDGLMLKEAEKILQNRNSVIVVFLTPKTIYTLGSLLKNSKETGPKNFICGECALKRLKDQLFTLKLFDSLIERVDYLTLNNIFLDEYIHFSMILEEICIFEKGNRIFTYDTHSSLCTSYEISGLTLCPTCDTNDYSQHQMFQELGFLMKGDKKE